MRIAVWTKIFHFPFSITLFIIEMASTMFEVFRLVLCNEFYCENQWEIDGNRLWLSWIVFTAHLVNIFSPFPVASASISTIEVAFSQPYEPRTGSLSLRIFLPFFLPPEQVHLLKFFRAYRFAISQTKFFSVSFCPPFCW